MIIKTMYSYNCISFHSAFFCNNQLRRRFGEFCSKRISTIFPRNILRIVFEFYESNQNFWLKFMALKFLKPVYRHTSFKFDLISYKKLLENSAKKCLIIFIRKIVKEILSRFYSMIPACS